MVYVCGVSVNMGVNCESMWEVVCECASVCEPV